MNEKVCVNCQTCQVVDELHECHRENDVDMVTGVITPRLSPTLCTIERAGSGGVAPYCGPAGVYFVAKE